MPYPSGRLRVKEYSGVNFVETSVLASVKNGYEMKTINIFAALSLFGLLASLSSPVTATVDNSEIPSGQDPPAGSDHEAIAKCYEDKAKKRHEIVAKYYEDEARKAQAKTRELKLLLEHYGEKSYLYGKKAQDLQAHTMALVRKHEQAAKADAREAAIHRQIALQLKEKHHAAASNVQKFSVVNESH